MFSIYSLLRNSFLFFCATFFANSAFADLPPVCQQLFKEAEVLVMEAEKQPGTHPNLMNIKEKLDTGKAKLLKLPPEAQIKSCDLGLAKLNYFNQNLTD